MKSPLLIVRPPVPLLSIPLLTHLLISVVNRCKHLNSRSPPHTQAYHTILQLASATPETLEILKNQEIIAINQDPVVGTSITPFRWGVNVRVGFSASAWFAMLIGLVGFGLTAGLDVQFYAPCAVLEWQESERDSLHVGAFPGSLVVDGIYL